ncbi:coronin-6 isoform X1 [Cloeon dipterum]|uniref:coronin-6 isoform X1 n=1 Tax=Cloeon dipterum TaxID=197152 RepID=UPI00321F9C5E
MSFRVVRSSKFRHVYGTGLKRDQCFDNIRVSKSSWDSTFCAVNPKFLAIIVESAGGGAFIVMPLSKVGRINPDHPLVGGHKGPVLDIAWCPHNDNVIASGSEDCVVKVWQIPDSGISRTLTDPIVDLVYHQRRVGLVLWHPSAQNVLLTAGSDNLVLLWNVGIGEVIVKIDCHPDIVYSACWNWDGSSLLTTCKDKKIRIINPRTGDIEEEAISHEGSKATRAIFLRSGLVFTTGFSKMSERQYSLRAPDHLSDPIVMVELDTSNGVMFPLYDPDTNLVYLCGKGDSVIRYFEITAEPPFVHYISTFQTPDPQRGIGMMPKRGCDVNSCEISRFFRLNNSGLCQVITFTVPRKSELFQEDLYPDTPGEEPAITAEEWLGGKDAEPLLISLRDGYAPSHKKELKVKRKNVLDKMPPKRGGSTSSMTRSSADSDGDSADAPVVQSGVSQKVVDDLMEEIRKLKAMIVKHENRIRSLETKVTGVTAPPLGSGASALPGTPAPAKPEESKVNSSPAQSSGEEMAPDEV